MIYNYLRNFTPFIFLLLSIQLVSAQAFRIEGKIAEKETGLPLPGATIQAKESSQATITDRNGHFSLSVSPGDLIEIKFLGFRSKELMVDESSSFLDIHLEEDRQLIYEVVVTGALGIRRASRELGVGTQVVDNDYLTQGKQVNPLTALTSKVAGLRVNMYDSKVDPEIRIIMRGSRSLNRQANAPIYVVDGVPVPDINRLNPNDIESITVLKGANAAALYGSDGVNGALMITTKQGSGGNEKVTFAHTTSFSQVFLLPQAQNQFGQGQNRVYSPLQSESWGPRFDGTMRDFGPKLPDGTQPQLLYAAPSKDNRLDLFQTGIQIQNDVSFSGGNETNTYFLSIQDVRISGILPGDESSRTGIRLNGSRKFGRLRTLYNANYVRFSKSIAPDGPWLSVYTSPANIDYPQMKNWQDASSIANPANYFTDQLKNPFFLLDNYRQNSDQSVLSGKLEWDYEITPWLSAIYRLGYHSKKDEKRNTTGKFEAKGKRNVNGAVTDISEDFERINGDLILNFDHTFGKVTTNMILGQNFRTDRTRNVSVGATNLLLPDLFNTDARVGELAATSGSSLSQYRSLSVYGELIAGYDQFLFLTLTGRNDWVSVLHPNNRSYFYPGVSTSLILHEAIPALQENETLTFAKVFASWNKTGNVTLDPYKLNNPYTQINGFPFGNLVGFTPGSAYPNPDIQPEFVTSYEFGTQLSFFKHRLHLESSYVFSDSEGQIFNSTLSRATGYSSAIVNAGRLTNRIIEVSLSGDILVDANRKLNLGLQFSKTNNRVEELYEGNSFNIFRQSYAIVGEPYPSLLVSDYKRDPQGRIVINEKTGYPVLAEQETLLGTMVPPYQLGLNGSFSYKNLSIGFQAESRWGGWLYSEIIPRQYTAGTHPRTVTFNREPFVYPNSAIENSDGSFTENTSVISPGDKAFWDYEGKIQVNTAAKSDFFKLREVNVTYRLPEKMLAKQKLFSAASITAFGNNLIIIRHKDNDHGDPEYLYNATDGYVSFRQVPPYRSYGFNLNFEF